jgi:hypothetical protein
MLNIDLREFHTNRRLVEQGFRYDLDLRRFRGLFQTENSARKGEHCHEQTRPTHRSFAEKLSGWSEPPMRLIPSPGIARQIGVSDGTLRNWVNHDEIDPGERDSQQRRRRSCANSGVK